MEIDGTFEINRNGGGWIRSPAHNYAVRGTDPVVPAAVARRHRLRGGESVKGVATRTRDRQGTRLIEVTRINELDPGEYVELPEFADLTVIDPHVHVRFETPGGPPAMRIFDLLTPIGLGQRGLIVAAPRTGKTVLLKQMAQGLAANHPDVACMVLLIDERPEEVTEMRRSVRGEVVASSNDHGPANHMRIARLMFDKVKRQVECGKHVFILLDSLTRLARAANTHERGSGRIMSGGLDSRAMTAPKAMFGAARKIEHGGSLTVIASILVETGSRMDDVIFNEFKGTGNMEVMLSQELANLRLWPAIHLQQSGTRKEELLLNPDELRASHRIRRTLLGRSARQEMESLLAALERHPTNEAFVASLPG